MSCCIWTSFFYFISAPLYLFIFIIFSCLFCLFIRSKYIGVYKKYYKQLKPANKPCRVVSFWRPGLSSLAGYDLCFRRRYVICSLYPPPSLRHTAHCFSLYRCFAQGAILLLQVHGIGRRSYGHHGWCRGNFRLYTVCPRSCVFIIAYKFNYLGTLAAVP